MFDLFRSTLRIESPPLLNSFGARLQAVFRERGQLCVGVDISLSQLSLWGLSDSTSGVESFCQQILDACYEEVGVIKLQVAFFEQFGSKGFSVLEKVIASARAQNLLIIADAKRGDIGSTMEGYARAWLSNDTGFDVDAVTLSPYLGAESLLAAVDLARNNNKGVFILAATSNSEAELLQGAITTGGQSVAANMAGFAVSQNAGDYGPVGLVIGAMTAFETLGIKTASLASTPLLVPGFGAQGAKLSEVRARFGVASSSVLCNVSRSIAGSSPNGLKERVVSAKRELQEGLAS